MSRAGARDYLPSKTNNSSACESANTAMTQQQSCSACYDELRMMHGGLSAASIAALGEFAVAEVLLYGRNADARPVTPLYQLGLGGPQLR
jgi:hypothetical protein